LKIVVFYQYFATPKGSWGTRYYDFASEWVKAGHDVTIVTSIYSKSDLVADKLLSNQTVSGIQLKVINLKIDNKQHFIKRVWSFIAYAVISTWYALTLKCDLVIASSGPITAGLPGLVARYIKRRTFVFEVRDLWPDGAIELGLIKNRVLINLAKRLEKSCYDASQLIVTLSPGMRTEVLNRVQNKPVISITNAADIELFGVHKALNSNVVIQRKYIVYTGNLGRVNNSLWLVEIAKELKVKCQNEIKVLLIGEGQLKEKIIQLKEKYELSNLEVLPLMPKEELVPFIQNALFSLVPLENTPILNTSSPNKLFESIVAGVPVIQNTTGWIREFLENNNIGYTLAATDAHGVAELIQNALKQPDLIENMSNTAKLVGKQNFDKNNLAQQYLNALLQIK
jgi:glycosyltransferase involved in cell wall biosynthesis